MRQVESATKFQWITWFPYPTAWLRALGLFLLFNSILVVLNIVVYWGLPVTLILSKLQQDPKPMLAFFIAFGFAIPIIVISCIHYILFGKSRPYWLPKIKSLWVGFYSWIVAIASTLVCFVLVIPFVDKYHSSYYRLRYFRFTDTEVMWLTSIWLITAAYSYHIEYLIRRWLAKNFKQTSRPFATSQSVSNNPNIDDVDVQLDNLCGQMGLHKMKRQGKSNPKNQ